MRHRPGSPERARPGALVLVVLRAHRWGPTLSLSACCVVLAWLVGRSYVGVPLASEPVPLWTILVIAATVGVLPPLASSFPELEPTLVREPGVRVVRLLTALGLAGGTIVIACVDSESRLARHVALMVALLLLAIGIASVVVLGELAWAMPLAFGLIEVVVDGGTGRPVTEIVVQVPVAVGVLALLVAAILFVLRGPRRR